MAVSSFPPEPISGKIIYVISAHYICDCLYKTSLVRTKIYIHFFIAILNS